MGHEQQRGCKPPWFLFESIWIKLAIFVNLSGFRRCEVGLAEFVRARAVQFKIEQDSPGKLHALEHASKIWEELLLVGCVTSSYPTIVGVRDKILLETHFASWWTKHHRRSGVPGLPPHFQASSGTHYLRLTRGTSTLRSWHVHKKYQVNLRVNQLFLSGPTRAKNKSSVSVATSWTVGMFLMLIQRKGLI